MSIQKIKREELDSLIQDASVRTKRKPTDLEKKEGMKRFLKQNRADQKSEYIAGETIMHSPAVAFHTVVRKNIEMYIHEHIGTTGKGMVQSEKAAIIFGYNVFEPDVVYWNETVNIEKKTLVHPIPHFIAEVLSPSTKGRDRTVKKNNYEKSQVQEYWIVDTDKQTIQQYVIDKETKKYVLHKTYFEKDTIESVAIEGFYVSLEAVFSYRMPSGPYKIILQKRAEEILKKTEQEKQKAIEREQQAIEEKQQAIEREQQAIEEKQQAIEKTQKEKTQQIINALKRGKLSIEEIAEDFSITTESVLHIQNTL